MTTFVKPNPFTPGNGIEPKYLAGREEFIKEFTRSLDVFEGGLPQNTVVYGLRGTGKTVLSRHYKLIAETKNWIVIEREFNFKFANEELFGNSMSTDIAGKSAEVSVKRKLEEASRKLVDALKPESLSAYGLTYKPYYKEERKILTDYLKEVLISNWPVFQKAGKKGVLLLYDEMHNVRDVRETKEYPLSSILEALSYVQREGYKYYLCASGLPPLKTNLKEAKTYTERMFHFQEVTNLSEKQAEKAINETLRGTEYSFDEALIQTIIKETAGYPYFLQFYGYFLIENTNKTRLGLRDFELIKTELVEKLDKSFFEDRFNLASPLEKNTLAGLAKQKENSTITELAKTTKTSRDSTMQALASLQQKGLIYREARGKYKFTIPLFQQYLQRKT